MKGLSPLAETLTVLLEERGMTVKELARVARVSRSTLQEWFRGASPRNFHELKRVSDALGASFERVALGQVDADPRIEEMRRERVFDGMCYLRIERLVLPGTGAKE